jgi:hypothetical protein
LLEIDGVPAELNKGVAVGIGVGACDVRAPVPDWVCGRSPDASIFGRDTRGIDIVAVGFF